MGEEEGKIQRRASALVFALLLVCMATSLSNLQTAKATTTIYILADGSLSPVTAPIQRNGNIYTLTSNINSDADGIVIEKNNTILDGAGYALQGTKTPSSKGIYLSGNYNVTIKNINIKTFEYGILLDAYSTSNSILGNVVENNDYGINCWAYADNNSIIGNNITGNRLAGIWIVGSSNDTISQNNVQGNSQYGISLESAADTIVYHNNFIDNTNQVHIYDSTGTWDNGYPSGGNYWSDYTGKDVYSGPYQNELNSDGIGDTPYNCSENNQDRYPLMQTFTNVAVRGAMPIKTVFGQGYDVTIAIQVENQGWETVTTIVVVTVDTTMILNLSDLAPPRTVLTSTGQSSGHSIGNYTVSATATAVPDETDKTDNNCAWTVHVGVPGDVSSSIQGAYDGTVNIRDVAYMILLFNARPASPNWNPNADVNDDGVVNMRDIAIAIANFNQHE